MGLVSKQPDDEESLEHVQITGFGPLDDEEPDAAVIDLRSWGTAARADLDERFHLLEAPHGWSEDGGLLVVPADSAAWIQRIIEQVSDERAIDLDADADQIAYDLTGWDDGNRNALRARLDAEEIPYAIELDELVVLEVDEVRVDEVIDAILDPTAPAAAPVVDDREEARPELMGDLFVAADRLVHDPGDPEGRRTVTGAAAEVSGHAPPYGVEAPWWRDLADRTDAFARLLAGGVPPEHEDRAVSDAATELRDHLRPYV